MYILYIDSNPTTSFEVLYTVSEIHVKVDHTRGIIKSSNISPTLISNVHILFNIEMNSS